MTIDNFTKYQIEWLTSHNDIEFNKEEEDLIIQFLRDTAKMYQKENECEDCISREEAISALDEHKYSNEFCNEHNIDWSVNLGMAHILLNELPSVTSKARWIPVSERLPEREGWYLTSLGDKTYGGADVDMYCKGWVKYGTHVLAWMPLPQPYMAESEE